MMWYFSLCCFNDPVNSLHVTVAYYGQPVYRCIDIDRCISLFFGWICLYVCVLWEQHYNKQLKLLKPIIQECFIWKTSPKWFEATAQLGWLLSSIIILPGQVWKMPGMRAMWQCPDMQPCHQNQGLFSSEKYFRINWKYEWIMTSNVRCYKPVSFIW